MFGFRDKAPCLHDRNSGSFIFCKARVTLQHVLGMPMLYTVVVVITLSQTHMAHRLIIPALFAEHAANMARLLHYGRHA